MGTIGIDWVNNYHGRASDLANNHENAQGFYNRLIGVRQFQHGDDTAFDTDFEQNGVGQPSPGIDHNFADDVDIVFFSGHGSRRGPLFGRADRDDGEAHFTEIRLGNKQCQWAVFDASEVLAEGSVTNWTQAFKGLHYILGFHTPCQDKPDRGRRFAERLNAGMTIREAWIKACKETEGSDTYIAYLRADQAGHNTNTENDHWIGRGYVSPDPVNPTTFRYLKTPC